MSLIKGKTWFSSHMASSSGEINMNVSTSTAAKTYRIGPAAADEVWDLARVLIFIQDTGVFRAEGYGSGASTGLANGILFQVTGSTGNVVLDLLDGSPIQQNADWTHFCYDADVKTWGAGDEMLASRWTFSKAGIPLRLSSTETLDMVWRDSSTNLVAHHAVVQGYKDK